jgi:hypothetical protein
MILQRAAHTVHVGIKIRHQLEPKPQNQHLKLLAVSKTTPLTYVHMFQGTDAGHMNDHICLVLLRNDSALTILLLSHSIVYFTVAIVHRPV